MQSLLMPHANTSNGTYKNPNFYWKRLGDDNLLILNFDSSYDYQYLDLLHQLLGRITQSTKSESSTSGVHKGRGQGAGGPGPPLLLVIQGK